ncbi:hypothetical protein [Psychrobacillus sp. OK032]|uniref:hypothetical protein n=1 Tax=Psychrobacillus sp. OK032 TaxID=1884358 RepID=UPI0008CC0A35|nr:hypothetical protein [Psychrobacillus sp. OK032]SES10612.1 hypothetical protein SAMN05518872_104226 [Psychrobacillus sp. OK032]
MKTDSEIVDIQHSEKNIVILTEKQIYMSTDLGVRWNIKPAPENSKSVALCNKSLFVIDSEGKVFREELGIWNSITQGNSLAIGASKEGILVSFRDGSIRNYHVTTKKMEYHYIKY